MNVYGTVVSVETDVSITKKDGGTYQGSRLSYRDETGALKEQAFHNNAFKFNAPLKVQLTNLNNGDKIIIEKEKKGEFWNVMGIHKDTGAAPSAANNTTARATASPKSTYETPEERAQKQIYIVRQSAINAAIALAAALGDKKATQQSIISQAKVFEAYVFDTGKTPIADDFPGDEDDVVQ